MEVLYLFGKIQFSPLRPNNESLRFLIIEIQMFPKRWIFFIFFRFSNRVKIQDTAIYALSTRINRDNNDLIVSRIQIKYFSAHQLVDLIYSNINRE